jgi:hypothetical protein
MQALEKRYSVGVYLNYIITTIVNADRAHKWSKKTMRPKLPRPVDDLEPYGGLAALKLRTEQLALKALGRWFKAPVLNSSGHHHGFSGFSGRVVKSDRWTPLRNVKVYVNYPLLVNASIDLFYLTGQPVLTTGGGDDAAADVVWEPDYSREKAILFCLLERGLPQDMIKLIVELFVKSY